MFLKWFFVCIVMARPTILGCLLLSHLIVFQPRRSTPLADESRLSVISFPPVYGDEVLVSPFVGFFQFLNLDVDGAAYSAPAPELLNGVIRNHIQPQLCDNNIVCHMQI